MKPTSEPMETCVENGYSKANECLGTKAKVQERVNGFFGKLAHRGDEVRRRCRRVLQARAEALKLATDSPISEPVDVVSTLALV
jgi:hypothetical protein